MTHNTDGDIKERLRRKAAFGIGSGEFYNDILNEAADHITALETLIYACVDPSCVPRDLEATYATAVGDDTIAKGTDTILGRVVASFRKLDNHGQSTGPLYYAVQGDGGLLLIISAIHLEPFVIRKKT